VTGDKILKEGGGSSFFKISLMYFSNVLFPKMLIFDFFNSVKIISGLIVYIS